MVLQKTFLTLMLLISTKVWAKPFLYTGGGMSQYTDNSKSEIKLSIRQTPIKIGLGQRYGHLEFELQYRLAEGRAKFIHDNQANTLIHKSSTIMAGIGVYTIPAIRLQAGITFQNVQETLADEVSAAQEEDIKQKYNLTEDASLGTYLGFDLHLLTLFGAKLLVSGTTYFNPSFQSAKDYEASVGIKIPFGGGGRSSNFNPLRSMSER